MTKKEYKLGDVFENNITKDKVMFIGMIPIAIKLDGESPNLHPDDYINLEDDKWVFVENRNISPQTRS